MVKNRRSHSGFTMVEMLIAVGVLVVLMGLGFVGVQQYRKSLKQLELDEAAREIYITAQNHLTVAKSQGVLQKRDAANNAGTSKEHKDKNGKTTAILHYYYLNSKNATSMSQLSSGNVLYDMLPPLSLDDKVRAGGTYAIEYDLDSANIIQVYYSDQSDLSMIIPGFSEATDYKDLFEEGKYSGSSETAKENRRNYRNGQVIGWYGGDDIKGAKSIKLYAPTVELINKDRLEVKVSFPMGLLYQMTSYKNADPVLKLYIQSKDAFHDNNRKYERQLVNSVGGGGSSFEFLSSFRGAELDVSGAIPKLSKYYVLDDISKRGSHFYEQWHQGKGSLAITPGDDIVVYAEVSSNKVLSNIPTSLEDEGNSLFAKIDGKVAQIAYIRHLENLDPLISGYDGTISVTAAKQISASNPDNPAHSDGLYWDDFKKYIDSNNPESVSVAYNNIYRSTERGSFAPVNPILHGSSYLKSYDGGGMKIANIVIKQKDGMSEVAGVFGDIKNSGNPGTIKDLQVTNFSVQSSSSSDLLPTTVGALAGSLTNVNVNNVLVYNDVVDDQNKIADQQYEVAGTGSVGGLVGSMNGGSITQSAAAVYVRSTGGDAGGLVGKTTGTVTITQSYSGGHTDGKGNYLTSTTTDTQGRVNVQASGNAGGLVGNSANATIDGCYSTCSVKGGASSAFGGLVGSIDAGKIDESYAVGKVVKDGASSNVGCFAGKIASADIIGSGNTYFSIVNLERVDGTETELPAIGGTVTASISPFDTSTADYDAFMIGAKQPPSIDAVPYDASLRVDYGSKYPMQSIKVLAGLDGESLPVHVAKHYGDWPTPETLVVNTP